MLLFYPPLHESKTANQAFLNKNILLLLLEGFTIFFLFFFFNTIELFKAEPKNDLKKVDFAKK